MGWQVAQYVMYLHSISITVFPNLFPVSSLQLLFDTNWLFLRYPLSWKVLLLHSFSWEYLSVLKLFFLAASIEVKALYTNWKLVILLASCLNLKTWCIHLGLLNRFYQFVMYISIKCYTFLLSNLCHNLI